MQRTDNVRPIIIKRKKRAVAEGHHGGAWKVAYADFVTAMMAFFLMLWLLGSVDDNQRKGIADYFSPTVSQRSLSSGSDGILGGEAVSMADFIVESEARRDQLENDQPLLEEITNALTALSGQSQLLEQALQHVNIRLTDEGLVVELFDLPASALFEARTETPNPVLLMLLDAMAEAFGIVENSITINVHSASFPSVIRDNPVWGLSVARAQKVRSLLLDAEFSDQRIQRVSGHADRVLAVAENPMDVRNNRIELILLRNRGTL